VLLVFGIFLLLLGIFPYAAVGLNPEPISWDSRHTILMGMPMGLIIAGLFAAALSTLAGSISSLSSSAMMDLYTPLFGKNKSESTQLKISRLFSIMWAVMLVGSALFFMNTTQTVVELALSIASFTYGGLLGTFLLGLLVKRARQKDALAGFTAGIIVMIAVISLKLVAWTWFTIIGVYATMLIGGVVSLVRRK